MPLVINILGGGLTHMHAYKHCGQKQFQDTRHTLTEGGRMPGLMNTKPDAV